MADWSPEVLNDSPGTQQLHPIGGSFEAIFVPHAYSTKPTKYNGCEPIENPTLHAIGLFIVKRFVERDDVDVFADSNLGNIVESYRRNGQVIDNPGLSVINRNDAVLIRNRTKHMNDDRLHDKYLLNMESLAETRFYRVLNVDVFGPRNDRTPGVRHVVLVMDSRSHGRNLKDRTHIMRKFGHSLNNSKDMSHVTLFRTKKPALARELCAEITALEVSGKPIKVGKAQPCKINKR